MVEKIKIACNEKNMRIADLEMEVGLSKGNLSRWAKSCPSSITSLVKIAEILNLSTDYILNTEYIGRVEEGRSKTLNKLLSQTKTGEIKWNKMLYAKVKKISVINCLNEIVYNSNIFSYETEFSDFHLIFVHYNSDGNEKLFLEQNNEYIMICENDSYVNQIYYLINNHKNDILKDFFSGKDKKE